MRPVASAMWPAIARACPHSYVKFSAIAAKCLYSYVKFFVLQLQKAHTAEAIGLIETSRTPVLAGDYSPNISSNSA